MTAPARLALLACLCALVAGFTLPGTAAASPLDGKGMWIWYVSASGGSAAKIAKRAGHHHLRTVFVKSGDGTSYWSQFSRPFVAELHRRGLDVCAWQFVYGSSPRGEARVGAAAVENGADCLVIDAESSYEGRYGAAERYVRALRRRIGAGYPLALAGFPYVDYHPSFPYSVFLGRRGAQFNLPQMYWHTIGTSPAGIYSHTYRFNRPYDRPIYPLGQTYANPGRREILDFRRYGREYGARGMSWWSWQETSGREWRWVGRRLHHGVRGFEPARGYAALRRGGGGDLVVLAQEWLNAAGAALPVTGYFGGQTEAAVVAFQRAQGLPATGVIRRLTWQALAEREPQWVSWSKLPGARRPFSASLPTKRVEFLRLSTPCTYGCRNSPGGLPDGGRLGAGQPRSAR